MRIKRLIDIVASAALLVPATPIILLAAGAIVVTSGKPIFYTGKRWGRGDAQFSCFKLRTMRIDRDGTLGVTDFAIIGHDGRTLVYEDDPRIDKVGGFLRRFSIDELPQLLNVLRGEMSLIGPRALAISMLEHFPEIRHARGTMRPGMSGLWQVRNRRKNVSVLDMVDDDLEYIRSFSLALDFKIALLTFPKVLKPQ